jgi:ribosomal-protein-alanine N-acetyltransferase
MATPSPIDRFILRSGETSDVEGVMGVMNAAFNPRFGEAWTRSQLIGILPMAGVDLTVAVNQPDGSTAGFSLSRRVADEAELLLIAVNPSQQRQGLGLRLLERFLAMAADNGIARVHLEVRDGNPAVAMYRSVGFDTAGRRRDYYLGWDGHRHDAITLARELQS